MVCGGTVKPIKGTVTDEEGEGEGGEGGGEGGSTAFDLCRVADLRRMAERLEQYANERVNRLF